MKHFIEVKNLIYKYKLFRDSKSEPEERLALDSLSLSVDKGDFVAILGPNGSGKSTLARQLSGLLFPAEGVVLIKGGSTADQTAYADLRSTVAMVFQNPDNQIIGTTVEEDLAFGPENMACQPLEMERRIEAVLETMGLRAWRFKKISELSGGQKQKTAIAGVLAMEPDCIIFDEPTAMIDPAGRDEVIRAAKRLNRVKGITIIYISHDPEEVKEADYIYLMDQGRIRAEGKAEEVFARTDCFDEPDQQLPCFWQMRRKLLEQGVSLPADIISEETFFAWMAEESDQVLSVKMLLEKERKRQPVGQDRVPVEKDPERLSARKDRNPAGLWLDHLSYTYPRLGADKGPAAIRDISLRVRPGEYLAIVGRSGSGKTTLLKQMNGLVRPDQGEVYFHGDQIWEDGYCRRRLRQKVAYCFQYPENQLFEETVFKDVSFGPVNMGLERETCDKRASEALEAVGLDRSLWQNSPLTLSGGQKRRAALAGVIAMEPEYLILDEPTAGLDWAGKKRIFELLRQLNREKNMAIILVTHHMEDAAAQADRILVMEEGRIIMDDVPDQVFRQKEVLKKAGLDLPRMDRFYDRLFNFNSESKNGGEPGPEGGGRP